jgi:hypothetical protein
MVVLVSFSLLIYALLQLGFYNAQEAEYQFNKAQAFWLAEAGLEEFKAILSVPGNRNPIPTGTARSLSATVANIGSNRVSVADDPDWNNTLRVVKKYIITSIGYARNGAVQTNKLKASIRTFGDYLWSTHDEGNVNFVSGDKIYGRLYTDSRININGTPIFYALVQSGASSVNYASGGNSSVFTGGLQLGVPQLDWVGIQAQVNNLVSDPAAVKFTGNYDVTFTGTKAVLRNRSSGSVVTNTLTSGVILYVTGDAYVKGTVGTRATVATPNSIYITDDIVYTSAASKPADPGLWAGWQPSTTEALGLYSQKNVEIVSGVGAVNIHAAILASNGSFGAADRYNSIGKPYINFFGSMGQYTRGVIGQTSGTGYLKNYHYDTRFGELPPPAIPYSVYYFSDWQQL